MSTLSLCYSFHKSAIKELKDKGYPRIVILLSCQRGEQVQNKPKREDARSQERRQLMRPIFGAVEKFGKNLKDTLSPKQKGDWKDVVLMSLSFAVYVYISQQLVCAYCAWTAMLKQPW